jgi:6-phosphogluconolactonase
MSRRRSSSRFGPVAAVVLSSCGITDETPRRYDVYVGTYTGGKSEGIYRLELDAKTGALESRGLVARTRNPSFLALHPGGNFLYAVGELADFEGRSSGAISAFSIDPKTRALALLNQAPSGGAGPCHLVVDSTGRSVLAANYGGGSVCAVEIRDDGSLGRQTAFVQHQGASVNSSRQEGPHAHAINLDPAQRFALVPDLGLDKVLVYRFDPRMGTLEGNDPPAASLAPGSGPRHLAFHPGGRFAYVINELLSTVTAFAYDAGKGTLTEVQTISTLPAGFSGGNTTAEVVAHPSGRFLYGSNRGHDSIAVFAIDAEKGTLALVEHEPTRGKTPRNFGIDPSGRFLLAANQSTDTVVVFRIDPEKGALEPTDHVVEVPTPVCVEFLARP